MRARTNINLKDRNSISLTDFRGVDFSSSASNVQSNRASYMRNFICENGKNRKRNGWNELLKLGGQINGIYEHPFVPLQYIVHAGAKLYLVEKTGGYSATDISSGLTIKNDRSQAFYKSNKLYIFCGDYLVFDGNTNELKRVVDTDVYIPTTTISIDNDRVADTVRATLDDINCLTPLRKNTLVGHEITTNEVYWWTLDGEIDAGTTVRLEIETQSANEEGKATIEVKTYESQSFTNEKGEAIIQAFVDGNKQIGGWNTKGKIWLSIDTKPAIENQANITVTFSHKHELANKITGCTLGALFGVSGNTDTLFLSGNDNFKNICFYSSEDDFTYFPNKNVIAMGSDTYAVNGFARLSDSTLVAVKEDSAQEAGIYYITGSYETINGSNDARLLSPVYARTAGGIGEGIISRYCCANLAGDSLILTRNGVKGIVLGDNVARTERYTRNRSVNINEKLLLHKDLSQAVAIQHKDKYYLAIDGVCYIADARYKFVPNDTVDGAYNYEWWYWDNIPARVWASIDGELYFGTEQGQICVFDDKYTDRTYINIKDGMSFDITNNCVNADMQDAVFENDKIEIQTTSANAFLAILQQNATMNEFGEIQTDNATILDMHDSQEVIVERNGKYTKCYIGAVDWAECTYAMGDIYGNLVELKGEFNVLLDISNKECYITNVDVDNKTFQLKNSRDGNVLKLYNVSNNSSKAIITHEETVIAEWHTPVFDFGTIESSKTLLKMSIATEPENNGKLLFGYETRNAYKLTNAKGNRKFSFEDFSFENFSFDTGFANSYTVRCNVRNFNFIMFHFISDGECDCLINNFTVIYKINKSNRGVR